MATGTERRTDRLEAFSDAVLAIAITLPIVELHAPTTASLNASAQPLATAYVDLAPNFFAYAASVVVIGLYWAHSHFSGKIVQKTDHAFNLLTVAFLATVSVTPFPARPLFEHLAGDDASRTAAIVYVGVLTAPATLWFIRWAYAVGRGLPDPALAPDYLRALTFKYAMTASLYWIAFALAFWTWRTSLIIATLTTLSYLAPPSSPRFRPGCEPANPLHEADGERG